MKKLLEEYRLTEPSMSDIPSWMGQGRVQPDEEAIPLNLGDSPSPTFFSGLLIGVLLGSGIGYFFGKILG